MTTVETIGSTCGRFATKAVRALSATAAMLAVCALMPVWGDEPETTRIQFMDDTYLKGDGNQLIDLGYYANSKTKVVMEYEIVSSNDLTRYFFGNYNETFSFGMYRQNGKQAFVYGSDAKANNFGPTGVPLEPMKRFTATLDSAGGKMSISSGGKTLFSGTMSGTRTRTNDVSMKIFGNNSGGSKSGFKLYSFAVYDDGALVRDLIPYGRGAVTGLLDKCSGKVYTDTSNVSDHPFAIGTDDGYVSSERGSAQCLDTGYTANPQSKVEIDFNLADADTANQCVFSTGYGDSTLALYVNADTNFAWVCQDDTTDWDDVATVWHDTGVAADGARRTFAIDVPNGTVALVHGDGTTNYTAVIETHPTKSASHSLKLFMDATNDTGRIYGINPASVRLYGLKIHDGATLVRNYSPRLVDNVPGIYDALTSVFTNSASSYGLHFGGDIVCASGASGLVGNADAYLEFTGWQSINTGYTPTRNSRIVMDYGIFDRSPGSTSARCFFAANSTDNFYLYYNKAATSQTYQYPGGSTAGLASLSEGRFKLDINLTNKTNTATLTLGDTVVATKDFSKLKDSLELAPLCIGSLPNGNSRGTFRLYSFAIYEYGSDTPSHFYTPCMMEGVSGLWDSCDKVFKPNTREGGAAFPIGGAGVNGGGMAFLEQPQGCVVKRDQAVVLSAYAPGAVGYQWLKNGEIVEGATGPTLEVSYDESSRRPPDTYQCVSHYAIFGYGVSEPAIVEKVKDGMAIIFR